jgi:hypothetical protein
MTIILLDGSLKLDVFFDCKDSQFEDHICLQIVEDCPEDEKIFYAGETNIYLTAEQAQQISAALLKAIHQSDRKAK